LESVVLTGLIEIAIMNLKVAIREALMKTVTAKDLKNQTGKVLRLIASGQKVMITMRGKPFAVMAPITEEELTASDIRPYEEAWTEIEKTLKSTKPEFASVNEAMKWTRKRR